MTHTCHAIGCKKEVPPKLFMCARHWRMVPKFAQNDIYREYTPGQEIRKNPTNEYLKAAQRAQVLVHLVEQGKEINADTLRESAKQCFPDMPDSKSDGGAG